jgi:hypothetical protein
LPNRPIVLAAIRNLVGPLQRTEFSLLLQGWGFMPGATVSIKSSASAQCGSQSKACLSACPSACKGMPTMTGGTSPVLCRTDCAVQLADNPVTYFGYSLMKVTFDQLKNNLQPPNMDGSQLQAQAVDLLLLLSQPLQITVTNPDQSSVNFTETAMPMPMQMPMPDMSAPDL